MLLDSAFHGCPIAYVSSNHKHINTWRLLLQLLALQFKKAAAQHSAEVR
jgi:hypothetical protein